MVKLAIEVPEDVALLVADAAAERGIAPGEVAAQVLAEQFRPRRKLGS